MSMRNYISILEKYLEEDGRVVKGVNTTQDVGPDEISKQAAKFGNKVDKDGRPPEIGKLPDRYKGILSK